MHSTNTLPLIVIYENIDLIKPEKHEELIADLKERTGLEIHRIQVGRVDFLRDVARVQIFYYEDQVPTTPDRDTGFAQGQDD